MRFYVYFIALYVHYKISSPVPINLRFVYILYGMYMVPPQEAQSLFACAGIPPQSRRHFWTIYGKIYLASNMYSHNLTVYKLMLIQFSNITMAGNLLHGQIPQNKALDMLQFVTPKHVLRHSSNMVVNHIKLQKYTIGDFNFY